MTSFFYFRYFNYKLDVHMASPPAMDANGTLCTTGEILCGQAQGNVFNHADVADQVHVGPHMGKFFVYQSP